MFTFPLKGPIPFDDPALRRRVTMLVSLINYMQDHLHDSGELVQVRRLTLLYRYFRMARRNLVDAGTLQ